MDFDGNFLKAYFQVDKGSNLTYNAYNTHKLYMKKEQRDDAYLFKALTRKLPLWTNARLSFFFLKEKEPKRTYMRTEPERDAMFLPGNTSCA